MTQETFNPGGERGVLSGRTHVRKMESEIDLAVAEAKEVIHLDLSGFTGITPAAFDQVLGICRSAEQRAGRASGPIVLRGIPCTCRDMHHRIAGYHHLRIDEAEGGDWLLNPK